MIPKFRIFAQGCMCDVLSIDFAKKTAIINEPIDDTYIPQCWSITENTNLMQSTGLKDKNGVEIFEGDVIGEGLLRGVVKYYSDLGMWVSELVRYNNYQKLKDVASGNEVIGNIYENPEWTEYD